MPPPSPSPGYSATPDFYSLNVNLGGLLGWSGTSSIDRYGHLYWSVKGGGVGKSLTTVSASITINYLFSSYGNDTPGHEKPPTNPSPLNLSVGYWGGGTVSYSPGNGAAFGVGAMSPQAGVSYNYSYPVEASSEVKVWASMVRWLCSH
jgi:hypothetical protein